MWAKDSEVADSVPFQATSWPVQYPMAAQGDMAASVESLHYHSAFPGWELQLAFVLQGYDVSHLNYMLTTVADLVLRFAKTTLFPAQKLMPELDFQDMAITSRPHRHVSARGNPRLTEASFRS